MRRLLLVVLAATALAGCGNKGPLVLPTPATTPAPVAPGSAAPAPASTAPAPAR